MNRVLLIFVVQWRQMINGLLFCHFHLVISVSERGMTLKSIRIKRYNLFGLVCL